MNEINEIKIPQGVESISVTQHDDKVVIEFMPEKPKFKEGDFAYEDERIMIVKSYPNEIHAIVWYTRSYKPSYNGSYALNFSAPTFRHATEEEKQILIDAMKKDGKRWNAEKKCIEDIPKRKFKVGDKVRIKDGISSETHWEANINFVESMDEFIGKKLTIMRYEYDRCVSFYEDKNEYRYWFHEDWLEPYTDEPKKGDWAIFWDNRYLMPLMPLIRLYYCKTDSGNRHIDDFGTPWDNAVKWDGTKEQFEKVSRGEI